MASIISVEQVMARAQFWVDRGVTYSQTRREPDPEGKPYRTDCSGLCCMAYRLDSTDFVTYTFRKVPGIVSVGSLDELRPGDALLNNEHMELFVRWQNASNHREGAYVYSFNRPGETVRNPHRRSNRGNLGFNTWSEMTTYAPIRYTLIGGAGAPPSDPTPVLQRGSGGDAVRRLQELLNRQGYGIGVDGDFGPQAEDAVRSFQAKLGIEVDGVVGPVTWGRLSNTTDGSSVPSWPTLQRGSRGGDVEELQRRLNALGYSVAVDGDFGPQTENAVRDFQGRLGLEVDGVVGPITRGKLLA